MVHHQLLTFSRESQSPCSQGPLSVIHSSRERRLCHQSCACRLLGFSLGESEAASQGWFENSGKKSSQRWSCHEAVCAALCSPSVPDSDSKWISSGPFHEYQESRHRCLLVHGPGDQARGEVWPESPKKKRSSGFHQSQSVHTSS
ncbi:hypothetical protein NQZ68_028859 [Dissostichus eleginoides]|nr:hypothetical protein NQZ68_028859 [Dissostichus eleginoides]